MEDDTLGIVVLALYRFTLYSFFLTLHPSTTPLHSTFVESVHFYVKLLTAANF